MDKGDGAREGKETGKELASEKEKDPEKEKDTEQEPEKVAQAETDKTEFLLISSGIMQVQAL